MIKQESLFTTKDITHSERSLHTPGHFTRQNLLYVQEVGRLQSLKPHRCIREKLDSFLFMIVLEGEGSLQVAGREYALKRGCCAFIDCMEHYEHISDGVNAWRLAWVHFNGNIARAYYDLFLKCNHNARVFQAEDIEQWNQLIGKILEYQGDKSLQAELYCGEALLHLVNWVIDSISKGMDLDNYKEKQQANEVREYLNELYANEDIKQSMEQAFETHISELDALFGKYYGISIDDYITNRRLNAAKELLRFSIKPMEEIVEESGIRDIVLMQQLFRENEGLTAEEYRAKWAQWVR